MRCINNIKNVILYIMIVTLVTVVNGCEKSNTPLAYESGSQLSGFADTTEGNDRAKSFASMLCVAEGDIATERVELGNATAGGLFDINNINVIYAKNIHSRLHPASLTKIMTAIVALKHGNVDDIVSAGPNVKIEEPGAHMSGIKDGDKLTLNQLLHALLINSGNDVAVAIAEHIAGSQEAFATMMNDEALLIGATNSHFVNPHGLTDENQYVTAYDMYLIFNEALKYQEFYDIIQMKSYDTIYYDSSGAEKKMSFNNTNLYMNGEIASPSQIVVLGGKTGTTKAAGSNLIIVSKDASANPYISIVLQATDRELLYQQMTNILKVIN